MVLSPCCQAKLICDLNGKSIRCFDCNLPVPAATIEAYKKSIQTETLMLQ